MGGKIHSSHSPSRSCPCRNLSTEPHEHETKAGHCVWAGILRFASWPAVSCSPCPWGLCQAEQWSETKSWSPRNSPTPATRACPSSSQSQPLSCGFLVCPRYVGEVLETDTLVDPKALRRGFPKTQLFCRAYRRGRREELAG